jgi:hypothetical protein
MTRRHWVRQQSKSSRRPGGPRPRTRLTLEALEPRIVPSFKFIAGDTDGTIYAVDTAGDLHWYKDTHRNGSGIVNGIPTSFDAPNEGAVIGTGWNQFTHVVDGGGGVLYATEPNGDLLWYKDVARNGTWGWDPASGSLIGTGWNVFSQVVSGGNGVLYAIEPNGNLLWYQDLAQNGTPDWAAGSSNQIGSGWNEFIDVISNGSGLIYGRNYNGNLQWYQYLGQNGSTLWAGNSGAVVNTGWYTESFSHMLSGGEFNGGGIIYAVADDWSVTGVRSTYLDFYEDTHQNGSGVANGVPTSFDAPNEGAAVGYGWVYPTLEGYSSAMSAAPGGTLSFYVSTGGSTLTVTYLRLHVDASNIFSSDYGVPVSGSFQVPGQERPVTTTQPWAGAGWDQDPSHPADFSVTVPSWWTSGLYAAQVVDDRGYVLYITFVVNPDPAHHSSIAVLANINTWNCYNDWGGRSRYNDPNGTFPVSLSFLRPDPTATPIFGYYDDLHLTPPEVWFLSWLDNSGYSYDVYSDLDFDRGIPGLNQYQTLILDSHPEYWTATMYQNLQGYLNQGGDLLYLGGNGIFDMVQYSPDGTSTLVTTSPANRGPSLFMNNGMDEGQLLGVDYYWSNAGLSGAPYQVSAAGASHFFFQGTGVPAGGQIGQAGFYAPASGWEMDEAVDTIPGLEVLATGTNTSQLPADMTYYTTAAGGFVFSTGSITFTNSLAVDPVLQAIVRNALDGVLTYQMPAGKSENVTLRRAGNTLDLMDDQTNQLVASGPVGGVRSVHLVGAAGQVEGLTLDYASGGYFPLQNGLNFTGGNFDRLTVQGAGYVNDATYQPDPTTDGSGTLSLDGTPITVSGLGLLSVSGAGYLIVDDRASTAPNTYVVSDLVQVEGRSPQVDYSNLGHGLILYGGSANDTYYVSNTSSPGSTLIVTGSGDDTVRVTATSGLGLSVVNGGGSDAVTVGNSQSIAPLFSINGPVSVSGSGGSTAVVVDDSEDTSARTATFDTFLLTGLSPAVISDGPGVSSFTIDGGSNNNTYNIEGTSAGRAVTINAGAGNDTFNVTPATQDLDNLGAPLTLNGGGGSNVVTVDDQAAPTGQTYGISATMLTRSGVAPVTYAMVSTLAVNGGADGNAFQVVGPLPTSTVVTLNGGGGGDTLFGPATGTTTWTVNGPDAGNLGSTLLFTAMQNLAGGGGNNVFAFTAAGSVSGTVDGGPGTNKLDYSGDGGTPVTVNLQTAATPQVNGGNPGGFANIEALAGSTAGADTLIGPDAFTNWSITKPDAGTVNTLSFSGFEHLRGGTGVDVFKISASGAVASIDGGGAPPGQGDWLDYSSLKTPVTVNLATGSASRVSGGAAGAVTNIQDVHGGNGGNTLTGNSLGNILIGGAGSDTITGGTGASILIGDKGSDQIIGGSGGDILIGDSTTYDSMTTAHQTALMGILAEWQSADSYATRFHDIDTGTGHGLNGTAKLNFGKTVKDDGSADVVTAALSGQALDWFFQGAGDTLHNVEAGEHVNNS